MFPANNAQFGKIITIHPIDMANFMNVGFFRKRNLLVTFAKMSGNKLGQEGILKGANRRKDSMLAVDRTQADGNQVLKEVAKVHDVGLEAEIGIHSESEMVLHAETLNDIQTFEIPAAEIAEKIDQTFAE